MKLDEILKPDAKDLIGQAVDKIHKRMTKRKKGPAKPVPAVGSEPKKSGSDD